MILERGSPPHHRARRRPTGIANSVSDGTYTCELRKSDQAPLRMRLRELAEVRRRYGYRRLTALLQREGWTMNHKRIYDLYRQKSLAGIPDKEAKEARQPPRVVPPPFTRECLALHADRHLSGPT